MKIQLTVLFIAFIANIALAQPTSPEKPTARNIIFMIGDGTGIAQITAGMYSNNGYTNYERCPHIGMHKQHSADNLITDSAAGATAFSCGKKTYNGAVGVDVDTVPCPTLLELAEELEYATGLIATSTIIHATPAAFIAHVPYRKQYEDIAAAFPGSGIDLFIGGGQKYFERRDTDERNLIEEMREQGYQIGSYFDTFFKDWQPDPEQPAGYFTADKDPLPVLQGRNYLPASVPMAIDFLGKRSDKGFFLMIEGAQIDWGGHANDTEYLITEMIDFDKTIGKVLDFAEKDGNTLVLITGDHECGGFSLNKGTTQDTIQGAFTSDYHTAEMIPVFAFGPGSEQFSGIYDNTAIYNKIREVMGWRE